MLNTVNDIECLVERRLQSHKPSSLVFFVSVALSTGKTVLASDHHRGIYWTLCQVDHSNKSVVYADTLGWQVPEGLTEKVNCFIIAVYREEITDYEMNICHKPESTVNGHHSCTPSCAKYPVQTCSNVCGVISMVMAAVATHKEDLFLEMISRIASNNEVEENFLQKPTRYSKYLRRVIAAWIAEKKISMEYIVPIPSEVRHSDDSKCEEIPNTKVPSGYSSDQNPVSEVHADQDSEHPCTQGPHGSKSPQERLKSAETPNPELTGKDPTVSARKEPDTTLKCPQCSTTFS